MRTGHRRTDWADREARRLFDLVRACVDDESVIRDIAAALRRAAYSPSLDEALNSGDGSYRP